jgi:hypothetical protein
MSSTTNPVRLRGDMERIAGAAVEGAINLKEKLAALPVQDKVRREAAENLERGRRQTIGMGTTGNYWR